MAAQIKMIGIGDNVVDVYRNKNLMFPGGNALNFAVYAGQQGAKAAFLGSFGTDYPGVYNRAVLQSIGIDVSHCRILQGENGRCCIDLVGNDRMFVESNHCGVLREQPLVFCDEDKRYLRKFDWIHTTTSSYIENNLSMLRQLNVPMSYDFSDCFDWEQIQRISSYFVLSCLSCSHLSAEETKTYMEAVFKAGCPYVLATRGADGALVYDGRKFYRQKAAAVKVIDTLGAGDSMAAAFVFQYLTGCRNAGLEVIGTPDEVREKVIRQAMKKGALFASETCKRNGAFGFETSFIC